MARHGKEALTWCKIALAFPCLRRKTKSRGRRGEERRMTLLAQVGIHSSDPKQGNVSSRRCQWFSRESEKHSKCTVIAKTDTNFEHSFTKTIRRFKITKCSPLCQVFVEFLEHKASSSEVGEEIPQSSRRVWVALLCWWDCGVGWIQKYWNRIPG